MIGLIRGGRLDQFFLAVSHPTLWQTKCGPDMSIIYWLIHGLCVVVVSQGRAARRHVDVLGHWQAGLCRWTSSYVLPAGEWYARYQAPCGCPARCPRSARPGGVSGPAARNARWCRRKDVRGRTSSRRYPHRNTALGYSEGVAQSSNAAANAPPEGKRVGAAKNYRGSTVRRWLEDRTRPSQREWPASLGALSQWPVQNLQGESSFEKSHSLECDCHVDESWWQNMLLLLHQSGHSKPTHRKHTPGS